MPLIAMHVTACHPMGPGVDAIFGKISRGRTPYTCRMKGWERPGSLFKHEVDVEYLRAEFGAADSDGNGVLDISELRALLNKLGYITEATCRLFCQHVGL